jgi:transposase
MITEKNPITDPLPADVAALQALVRELRSELKISTLRGDRLEYKLRDLIRRLYGAKSEKLNPAQRLLFGILEETPIEEPLPPATSNNTPTTAGVPKKKGGGRKPKPENLPIRRQLIDLPEEQKAGLVKIREEITEQIEYQPSSFYRLHLVRPVYAHPKKKHAPIVAALPPQVIPQAGVGPGFIAHVLTAKYVDHLPLYRQERIDARGGVWISRQARCRYVEAAAHLLITIRAQLIDRILRGGYVQVDETFTKLMDPDRRGGSHDAYLWGYHAPHEKAVVFEFSPSRSGAILHDFFPQAWVGIVQTDGAKMYPSVFKHRPNIMHIECMAHLRRYVLDAIKSDEHQAVPLMKAITQLYCIERQAKDQGLTHEQRGYLRHAKAKPILKRLQAQFRTLERTAPPSGNLRDAVTYANNRWSHLVRYAKVGFGHVNIDNNPIEGTFRPTKVGLRNYLFIGHPAAGWRSAVVYTVAATCKLLGVNPEGYIAWVLPKLAAATNQTATGLLPHDYALLPQNDDAVTTAEAGAVIEDTAVKDCEPSPSS